MEVVDSTSGGSGGRGGSLKHVNYNCLEELVALWMASILPRSCSAASPG